jgi:flagellar hook assembly protein FlgD
VNGRMIRHLESSDRQRGAHRVLWDGRDDSRRAVASGIYLCRVAFHKSVLTKKLVLIK